MTIETLKLEQQFRRAHNRQRLRAFLFVFPLLFFILLLFVVPITQLLFTSIDNRQINELLPQTNQALKNWAGENTPPEEAYAGLIEDLRAASARQQTGIIARRLNYEKNGARTMVNRLARQLLQLSPPYKEAAIAIHKEWGETGIWHILKREGRPFTPSYYVAALDMQYSQTNLLEQRPDYQRIYKKLFMRTVAISAFITLLCLILGFPIAYLLSTLPTKYGNLLLILVLLPFWTSLLVRTTSWIVLLQSEGVVNDLLVALNIIDPEGRVRMVYNLTGTVVAMTHILLPFMILPLYSVMKTIPPSLMKAGISMGASWLNSFLRIYVPMSMPGISAGGLLVFILSIGYYITPALVGGSTGQLISNLIAYHIQESLNWGLGSALGALLLFAILALYWVYNRLVGIEKLKF